MSPITEVLTALRENRRGKGLYVEPTDCQVIQIWERADFFQDAIASKSFPNRLPIPSPAFALRKSVQSVHLKIQYASKTFSGKKAI